MLRLTCNTCGHRWEARPEANQRLMMCPNCGSLVPLDSAAAAALPSAELTAVPFALRPGGAKKGHHDEGPLSSSQAPLAWPEHDTLRTAAVVYLDLSNFRDLVEKLGKEKTQEIASVAKRVIRYALTQFGGTEANPKQGMVMVFSRPIDAVAYLVNLNETFVKVSRDVGLEIKIAAGVAYDGATVRRATQEERAKGSKALHVEGPARDNAQALLRLARGGQIYMTRAAGERARASAGGNDSLPPDTEWRRHGRFRVDKPEGPVELEVHEVGRRGRAPFAPPGGAAAPPPPAHSREDTTFQAGVGQSLREAFNQGAQQLGGALFSTSGQQKPVSVAGESGGFPLSLLGQIVGQYRCDAVAEQHEDHVNFLARDIYLARDVVLKVLRPEKASDPEKLTRFSREGLSVVYLEHPNLITGYDLGTQEKLHYIAYERVSGNTLAELVHAAGGLQPRIAFGYILQAARGLRFAHANGIIHRDIRPDNLLLSSQGTLKVAGLGLAKVRSADFMKDAEKKGEDAPIALAMENLTAANVSLGTPAYIAPEQAQDAANVDFTADQFSLGATLHFLLTGHPPYEGRTVLEVQANRKSAGELPAFSKTIPGVSKQMEAILRTLLQENPSKRYKDLAKLIARLEAALGVVSARVAGLEKEDLDEESVKASSDAMQDFSGRLAQACRSFYAPKWAMFRFLTVISFFMLMTAGAIFSFSYFSDFQVGGSFLGLMLLAPVMFIVLDGIIAGHPIYLHGRNALFGMRASGWALLLVFLAGGMGVLWLLGLLLPWALVAVGALAIALAFELVLVVPLRIQRGPALHAARESIKEMREKGWSEISIQEAIYRAADRDWEEFYEALFGYDAMLRARWNWRNVAEFAGRKRHAAWRDPIAGWLRGIEERQKLRRHHHEVREAEAARLAAQGVSAADADKRAREEAARLLQEERQRYAPAPVAPPAMAGAPYPVYGAMDHAGGYGPMRQDYYAGARIQPVKWVMRSLCTLLGSGIVLLYLLPVLSQRLPVAIPSAIMAFRNGDYSTWGYGTTVYALMIGGLIYKNAMFGRVINSLASIIGGALLVFTVPIVALVNEPQFNPQTAQFCGWALLAFSMGLHRRLMRMGGGGMF